VKDELMWSINGVTSDRKTEVIREILCPSATLLIKNPTWAALKSNLDLYSEKPVNNLLSSGIILLGDYKHFCKQSR
jgi:hypothetical protein